MAFILCFLLLLAAAAGLTVAGRIGWIGIPASAILTFVLFIFGLEGPGLAIGMFVAGGAAASLPDRDRIAAIPVGVVAVVLFLFVIPAGGADSPLNLIAAACALGFALGGMVATGAALHQRRVAATQRSGSAAEGVGADRLPGPVEIAPTGKRPDG